MNHRFWPTQGGVESSLYYIGKALIKKGHCAFILTEQYDKLLRKKEVLDGITVIRHPKYPRLLKMREDVIYLKLLGKCIKTIVNEYKIHSLWARNPLYVFSSLSACPELPVVYIMPTIFPLDTWEHSKAAGLLRGIYLKLESILQYYIECKNVREVKKIIVFSNSRKCEVVKYYKLDSSKVIVIPPGVDSERFQPRKRDKELLKELNIGENWKVVLTVGRLEIQKNILRLIEEFNLIRDKQNLKLVIVGEGSQRKKIEKYITKNHLERHVLLCGARREIERFYSIADVFVFPSIHEGFGQVLCEALASGVPCIAFKRDYPFPCVANEEIIDDRETGILVDYNQYGGMGKCIEELLKNDELCKKFRNNTRKSVLKKFNWSFFIKKILNL